MTPTFYPSSKKPSVSDYLASHSFFQRNFLLPNLVDKSTMITARLRPLVMNNNYER